MIPKAFFDDTGQVVKSLPGLLAVLHDGGYHDTEILRWLFTAGSVADDHPRRVT